jgi:hypothetical protein
MVDAQQIQRGSLLTIREGISVPLGHIVADPRGYSVDNREESDRDLVPGTIVVFMGVPSGEDDALVVLADGVLGWVFTDEVDPLQ